MPGTTLNPIPGRKVEKMKKFTWIIYPFLIVLMGCSGSDSNKDDPETPALKTGIFLDSAVVNIGFSTATQSGSTNEKGEFTYEEGETVTFSIGDLKFSSVKADTVITPLSLAGATTITDKKATNIARLLQSLDKDGNSDNGIDIPDEAASVATAINFDVDISTFENDPSVIDLVSRSGSINATLISATAAQAHVVATLEKLVPVVGAWRSTNGAGFSYLVMFADNTFLYAENDPAAQAPENGLEVGTYSYDANSGDITFTVTYDDNAPGADSGIGDIGTPAVFPASLSKGNNTLTLANGALVLSKADFTSISSTVGIWRATNGAGFSYLVMFADNTFLYAENDPAAQAPENGLEVGTYSYDANSGDITFTITYDDNAPGSDSGIGDSGGPVVMPSSLSNGNKTLSLAGGALVLSKVF